jgi:phosphoglycerol transferase MdoB-like AlkP superfamily enzyme
VRAERVRDRFMPWSGIALGTVGFFLTHQLGSDSVFQDCRVGSPTMVIVATIAGLALIALGALGSWRIYGADAETPARKLVAVVGLMASAFFALGVILPLIASLVIPQCWA